jgi:TDG/mug DNA glycosylase family protein
LPVTRRSLGGTGARPAALDRPRILFVGINPGMTSGRVGHNFAGPGNAFWRLLHAARITPELIAAVDDARLADFGCALVNLCQRTTRAASELTRRELERGRDRLAGIVAERQPALVALVGVTLAPIVLGRDVEPGPGAKRRRFAGARVFVVPNPSGLNATFATFDAKLLWFEKLARASRRQRAR